MFNEFKKQRSLTNVFNSGLCHIQLKDFKKISIKKGESEKVDLELTYDDLALFNIDMKRVVEPGEFTVMISSSSNNIHLKGNFRIE